VNIVKFLQLMVKTTETSNNDDNQQHNKGFSGTIVNYESMPCYLRMASDFVKTVRRSPVACIEQPSENSNSVNFGC
jgi:hypothetical protein